jgi:uncharacterized short protein YbdD (DUF466 family)
MTADGAGRFLRDALARARQTTHVIRRIIGAPDYDAYLTHARRCHPEHPVLSQDEFVRQRLTDRYSRPGNRCC